MDHVLGSSVRFAVLLTVLLPAVSGEGQGANLCFRGPNQNVGSRSARKPESAPVSAVNADHHTTIRVRMSCRPSGLPHPLVFQKPHTQSRRHRRPSPTVADRCADISWTRGSATEMQTPVEIGNDRQQEQERSYSPSLNISPTSTPLVGKED